MKIYIIAGEASGDLHGSKLIEEILKKSPETDIRCWGGDLMAKAGGKVVKHYRDLAFMGFWEVITNLSTILSNISFCKKDIEAFNPDLIIYIDYPGFNLRIAKWAKQKGYRNFYYISPQIWAWNTGRVHQIKKNIDVMAVILPFEKEFYKEHGMEVDFVGHPLLDFTESLQVDPDFRQLNHLGNKEIIALLPGSRKQEILKMLPTMLALTVDFPDYQFVVAGAPSQDKSFYEGMLAPFENVSFIQGNTYGLLQNAKAALVTSGTATLETALFEVPEIVCYKGNTLSYLIARQVIKVKYISLVNLILDRPHVKELIQSDFNAIQLKKELTAILQPAKQAELKAGYKELKNKLGNTGAAKRTADLVGRSIMFGMEDE
ncbi:MAG: lipid-A-disaccharide synthase [Saprospiraceae bacterium]|nr:lipid-A-disaccharide synthase [Saprospiraceae bacterium]